MSYTLHVTGLAEFQRGIKKADGDLAKEVRAELKEIGTIVVSAADARGSRYSGIGPYKPVVQQAAVLVRQSMGKVTGRRGDFGALQMSNVLIPVLQEKEPEVREGFEDMTDRLISSSGL